MTTGHRFIQRAVDAVIAHPTNQPVADTGMTLIGNLSGQGAPGSADVCALQFLA